jgi:hypothetical protein
MLPVHFALRGLRKPRSRKQRQRLFCSESLLVGHLSTWIRMVRVAEKDAWIWNALQMLIDKSIRPEGLL